MSKFTDDMDVILGDSNYHAQCMQIAPFGPDRCALLFEIGTQEHDVAYSVVFEVTGFNPNAARQIFKIDRWLTSLTSPDPARLFAVEVGRTVWRYESGGWTSAKFATNLMQRIWSSNAGLTLLVGDNGQSWEFEATTWSLLEPDTKRRLRDVHGPSRNLVHSVGEFGTVQRLVGNGWQALDIPIEDDLWGVFVTAGGVVRAAGNHGTCIRLFNEELIPVEAPDNRFFSVHQFQGETYWGDSGFGIYRESGDQLVEFYSTGTGWDIRSDPDYMYVVGGGLAWRFDGQRWNSLQLDYDGNDLFLIQ
jgi:hypothetical protein